MPAGTVDLNLTNVGSFHLEFANSTNYAPAAEVFNSLYGNAWTEWMCMMDTSAPRDSTSAQVVDNVGSVARASIAEHHIEPGAYNTTGTAAEKIVKITPFLTNAQMFIGYYNPNTGRARDFPNH